MKKSKKELEREERRLLIIDLLSQQKKSFGSRLPSPNKDMCTLIDLETGTIAGSGICPICHGFMGRVDGYLDDRFD